MVSLRQEPNKVGFEEAERFWLSETENLPKKLPKIEALVPMTTGVDQKVLHDYILHKFKEQTMVFTKSFKLRSNSPKIIKLRQELTFVINERGDNSERILSLESQIQHLVDEDLTQALQNRKNFSVLEHERPTKFFLNLENGKRGYNAVMMIKKENQNYN